MAKEIILTGLRSNSEYHLGNYIGALLPLVNIIKAHSKAEIYLFIPDLHSFTTPIDFSQLKQQTLNNLKLYQACGIAYDQDNIHIYRQSQIPAHSELQWILTNFSGFGELSRMVEFKQKMQQIKDQDQVSVGLFSYPILMAADILLYDATLVPVGDDQRQHLEFCRKLATRINQKFKTDLFVVPKDYKQQQAYFNRVEAPRIRSLRFPDQKMSKSIKDAAGTIMLSDNEDQVRKKVMSATTDSVGVINYDWDNQAGITNMLTILADLKNQPQAEINQIWQNSTDYQALKLELIQVINQVLKTIQANLKQVSESDMIKNLEQTEAKLQVLTNQKLHKIQTILGLR